MLSILKPRTLEEKYHFLHGFNPLAQTWIVADLRSKVYVQNFLLSKQKCLPEDSIIRMSELWRKILNRKHSDYDCVSSQYIATLLAEWLRERDLEWARHPGTASVLLNYIGCFLPVIALNHQVENMREWLKQNPEAMLRWGHWFELSVEAWNYFKEQKVLAPRWVSAYLSSSEESLHCWQRELFIDIGADLASTEIDLLSKLSEHISVTVFQPTDHFLEKYNSSLWPYELLAPKKKQRSIRATEETRTKIVCKRFTTQIAEVKSAVAQVRNWLDSTASSNSVAILAANIEEYWPFLAAYLKVEGIAVNKDTVLSAMSLPQVGKWFSRLRVESQNLSSADLELALFSSVDQPNKAYSRFKNLFTHIYDVAAIDRDLDIKKIFNFCYRENHVLKRDEFFVWSLRFWEGPLDLLKNITSVFLTECPPHTEFQLGSWIHYLQTLVVKTEIKWEEANSTGITVTSFDMAQNLKADKIILLGLNDRALKTNVQLSVSKGDIQKILFDLGLYIENPEQQKAAYLAERIMDQASTEAQFYFATTTFAGEAESPALLWLEHALKNPAEFESVSLPSPTRWDEIQANILKQNKQHQSFVQQDLGLLPTPRVTNMPLLKFSPSQLEKYAECPFQFTASKLLGLGLLPDVDLDVDAMTSGRILHACLEKLLDNPLRLTWSDSELENMVDKILQDQDLPLGEKRLWPLKRQQYCLIMQNFLNFESAWRVRFPLTRTVGRELRVEGQMMLSENLAIDVVGRIDRVDTDGEHYVVVDYKTSGYNLRNHGSWVNNCEIQLAFYAMALEQGLTSLPKKEVAAALYFVLKDMKREKGFKLKEIENLYLAPTRDRSVLTAEKYQQLMADIKSLIREIVDKIQDGNIGPQPKDLKICKECDWNTVCRAHHLN